MILEVTSNTFPPYLIATLAAACAALVIILILIVVIKLRQRKVEDYCGYADDILKAPRVKPVKKKRVKETVSKKSGNTYSGTMNNTLLNATYNDNKKVLSLFSFNLTLKFGGKGKKKK